MDEYRRLFLEAFPFFEYSPPYDVDALFNWFREHPVEQRYTTRNYHARFPEIMSEGKEQP